MTDKPNPRDVVMRDGDTSFHIAETKTDDDGLWCRIVGKRADTWVHEEELERRGDLWVWP